MASVLIVEDESIVAWNLREALENLGHTVVDTVVSGSEAIQAAEELRPQVVLMDIQLQGDIDGIAAGETIYNRFHIPIVYLTVHAEQQTLQRVMTTPPFGYLVKPFQEKVLHTTIEIAVCRSQMEQQLTQTLASIGDATIAINCDGRITLMNQRAEILTGWQGSAAIGQPVDQVLNFIHPQTRETLSNPLLQALQLKSRIKLPEPCVLVSKTGAEISVGDTAAPIVNFQGEVTGSVAVFQTLDETRQLPSPSAELFLHQPPSADQDENSKAYLQLSIACLHALKQVLVQAQQTQEQTQVLETIVSALCQALGADYGWVTLHSETSATLLWDTVASDHPPSLQLNLGTRISLKRWKSFYNRLTNTGYWNFPGSEETPPQAYQTFLTEQNQVTVFAMSYQSIVLGEIGFLRQGQCPWPLTHINFMVQVIQQCTTIWQQVFTHQHTQNRLNEMEFQTMRSSFIDIVSQELRNPLTRMRLAMEMLRETTQSLKTETTESVEDRDPHITALWQKADQYFRSLQEGWQQEYNLINDLLTFQTLGAASLSEGLAISYIRIQEWLPTIINTFITQFPQQTCNLQYQIASDLPDLASHAPSLERMITELLLTTCRWILPDQTIVLDAHSTEDQLVLQLTSPGLEVSRNELGKVFEPFYRLTSLHNNWQGNIGLGLALVKRLVIQLGGDIKAESQLGETTFIIILPFERTENLSSSNTLPTEL